ncbi:UDP-N-acetylmuramyl-tripeptide synthetase family protein [Chlamydia ibidis]|uniref:UDP-N-acetylmuramoyl-L-alanyl-D-glutamate--2,6-diaminopimelate ligase n=2 Tax=Chlamydia ibidis TaxID=1405396 RepID=S7J4B7_9CHLA|nr:UDP-N-acetylmuramoyl-L-alanyl-D-glutamate--2,6-diaminopimelate ligase [Chlamydia ibidis]EPP35078.1 UDP-N-acetylmuramyl-tripeptide synthetase family protein [Chlamydia ibidis]EQM62685.1 UDP-N-acetylmuramyl-tripeptide synthetase family protein [Chlamydia ibidis 10-1398/6]
MDLKELLHCVDAKVYGKVRPLEVRNLTKNSRYVGVGDIFIAHKGSQYDGNDFASSAVDNGAIAVVSSLYNPFLSVVQVVSPHLYLTESRLAAKYYAYPSNKLGVIGVTGTNGKTTVAHLIKSLLDRMSVPTGLIGTIGHVFGNGDYVQDGFTTPDACLLHKYLAEMVKNHKKAVVMEVSSIGLSLGRVADVSFDIGVFTNLTLDHLDFHDSLDEYLAAKQKLFSNLSTTGLAIVNADSPYVDRFIESTKARIVSYGISRNSDYRACHVKLSSYGVSFDLMHDGKIFSCSSSLIGEHNIYNILAAIAVTHQYLGCDIQHLISEINSISAPKGRLEPIFSGNCPVYIDYAHTPDALDNVCKTLQTLLPEQGRLIIVFGCGGDRERSKRKIMARVAETYGFSVVTSDNPRGEDPEEIINEICTGFVNRNFSIEIDRKQAITYALSIASDRDIVLVAGKGHETYQIFKHQTIPFDDKEVVQEVLSNYV